MKNPKSRIKTQVLFCSFFQEHFQKELIANLDIFQEDCGTFVNEYYENGPMQPGLTPREASDRLQMFQVNPNVS